MKKQIFTAAISAAMLITMNTGVMVQADSEYSIGIVQLDQIDLLDDITRGFEDAIWDSLGGDSIIFDEMSAEGSTSNYASIMNGFISENDNMIFVTSNEMLSAALSAAGSLPIINAGICDPTSIGSNVAGISALAPSGEQADLIRTILPDAKTVGIIYSEGNAFSETQASGVSDAVTDVGLTASKYAFNGDISSAVSSAADECDVIYLPADEAITANASVIASICAEKNKPVITADETTCQLCGLAVSTVPAYDLGYEAGQIAVKVLDGENPSSIGMKSPAIRLRKYNEEIANALGILIPDDFESLEVISIENGNDGIEEMTEEQIEEVEAEMNKKE